MRMTYTPADNTSVQVKYNVLSNVGDNTLLTGTSIYEEGTGNNSAQRIGCNNEASGDYSVVSGGYSNTASNTYSSVLGGYFNTAEQQFNIIGNGCYNTSSGYMSSVLNGCENQSRGDCSTIIGGTTNTTVDSFSTIAGGYCNTTNSGYGKNFIGNGQFNTISSYYGSNVIVGGEFNTSLDLIDSSLNNFIGAGNGNTVSSSNSVIGGGRTNRAIGQCSVVMGGCGNIAYNRSIVGGGRANTAGKLNTVDSISIISYTGTGVSSGSYFVLPSNLSGIGSGLGLVITFDGSGNITNTEIQNGGNLYTFGNQVLVNGSLFAGGSSPLNDVIYEIQGISSFSCASS